MSALIYGALWIFFNLVGRLLFGYRAIGRDQIPREGGVLVAANHASYLDIPFLGCGMRRRARFLGRSNLFPNPFLNRILQSLGWIPMRQDRLDRQGFGLAISLLRAGQVVVIYPEGSRTQDGRLGAGKPGIGMLVAETRCPVVPAYIAGTFEVLPIGARRIRRHPISVRFGSPIDFSADLQRLNGKDFYRHVSETVMARIAGLGRQGATATGEARTQEGQSEPQVRGSEGESRKAE